MGLHQKLLTFQGFGCHVLENVQLELLHHFVILSIEALSKCLCQKVLLEVILLVQLDAIGFHEFPQFCELLVGIEFMINLSLEFALLQHLDLSLEFFDPLVFLTHFRRLISSLHPLHGLVLFIDARFEGSVFLDEVLYDLLLHIFLIKIILEWFQNLRRLRFFLKLILVFLWSSHDLGGLVCSIDQVFFLRGDIG